MDAKNIQENNLKNKRSNDDNKSKSQNNDEAQNSNDNDGSDNDDQNIASNKISEKTITYKGFHRRDVNEMLREYATEMYGLGVRTEALLMIQVRPEHRMDDLVDR